MGKARGLGRSVRAAWGLIPVGSGGVSLRPKAERVKFSRSVHARPVSAASTAANIGAGCSCWASTKMFIAAIASTLARIARSSGLRGAGEAKRLVKGLAFAKMDCQ